MYPAIVVAPRSRIMAIVFNAIELTKPARPTCTAATIFSLRSKSGMQSATITTSDKFGLLVIKASAIGTSDGTWSMTTTVSP